MLFCIHRQDLIMFILEIPVLQSNAWSCWLAGRTTILRNIICFLSMAAAAWFFSSLWYRFIKHYFYSALNHFASCLAQMPCFITLFHLERTQILFFAEVEKCKWTVIIYCLIHNESEFSAEIFFLLLIDQSWLLLLS